MGIQLTTGQAGVQVGGWTAIRIPIIPSLAPKHKKLVIMNNHNQEPPKSMIPKAAEPGQPI